MRRLVMSRSSKDPLEAPSKRRRKDNHADHFGNDDDENGKLPAHLRGGVVSPRELHALTNNMQHRKEFKDLGNALPAPENEVKGENADRSHENEQLNELSAKRQRLQNKLNALEDRERFLAMVRARAKSTLEELKKRDKSFKDICGFDRRLRWDDSDFDNWRFSAEGTETLKSGKLGSLSDSTEKAADKDRNMKMSDNTDDVGNGICQKKRCKQHEGWYKLHGQDFAFEKSDRRRELHKLESEEKGLHERAMIRALESRDQNKVNGGAS